MRGIFITRRVHAAQQFRRVEREADRHRPTTAKLDRQSVEAMGQEIPLRSGMLVNADILLEKRSLLEWIFEPVLQLRGRL